VAAIAVLTLVALVRVATTHRVFSEVLDEPAHLAAGFQWLHGSYTIDASHPPLARVLGALPLWLADFPLPQTDQMVAFGNELLYHGDRYHKVLARVRLGNLLLLAIAIVATAEWARRTFSKSVAIGAAALLMTTPMVLGHAGVLTTDLAALTAIPLALLALHVFLEAPTRKRAALLGAAIGFGLLAKFSFIVFFPLCAVIVVVCRADGRRILRSFASLRMTGVILLVAFLVTWAGYRFDFRTPKAYGGMHAVYVFEVGAPEPLRPLAQWCANNLPMPAPAFPVGLGMLKAHNKEGHKSFLLGEVSTTGWWYYFPVVFFYKTPIPFLILAAWGAALVLRSRDRVRIGVLLVAVAIVGMSMTSAINIGLRHVLPMSAPLAIVAAYGAIEIAKQTKDTFGRTIFAALLVWLFAGVAAEHPDYLAWFNEAARPNPARIAVDSNLDWGQDAIRLERAVRELKIPHLSVDVLTNARLDTFGIPVVGLDPRTPRSGWIAVSETPYALRSETGDYQWLSIYRPVRRIGKSIRLYFIP
jgi:hypothetical protein